MKSDLRTRLRVATSAAHVRLHAHPGFSAAASGAISICDYRRLLSRLYGFHLAFEIAHRAAANEEVELRARSPLIAIDLETLGLDRRAISRLPLCEDIAEPRNEAERVGALYVMEGSTLGGLQIARALRDAIGDAEGRGRRFFLGWGEGQGALWRAFLARLERSASDPAAADAAVRSAVLTFDRFELWMNEWKPADRAPGGVAVEAARALGR